MRFSLRTLSLSATLLALTGMLVSLTAVGCASGGSYWQYLGGGAFPYTGSSTGPTGPSSTGQTQGGGTGQSSRAYFDPCDETDARKFITISMRNLTSDYIHYFFVAVAFVDVDQTDENAFIPFFDNVAFPDGVVCPNEVGLYTGDTRAPYMEIPAGYAVAFGDYCIGGPALYYFHPGGAAAGQFRISPGTGNTGLGAAIAPAQGSSPTYDNFFGSAGVRIRVPDLIIFHNPGSGEGAALKISHRNPAPCDFVTNPGDPPCQRDSFYYVDDTDIMAGSTRLGEGSGRRVPAEIQGTGCQCLGLSRPFQMLAPSRVTALGAQCDEFLRGGRIEYIFLREDLNPPFPQLVWKVLDASGAVVHDFDTRARLP